MAAKALTPVVNPTVFVRKEDIINSGKMYFMQNSDGWSNVMTGVGMKMLDKFENTNFALTDTLPLDTLSDLYRGEGLAKKIIDIPVKDMLRQGFEVEGDTDHKIPKYLQKIGLSPALRKGLRWGRQFGGSLIVMGIDDGPKPAGLNVLEQPLDENKIERLSFFRAYDRRQVMFFPTDIETDPTKQHYGQPSIYTVFPNTSGSTIFPMFRVHASRCLKFVGVELPERESREMYGWGDSVLQSIYARLRGFVSSVTASEAIIEEFIMNVMTINNLQDLCSNGNEKALIDRLNQVDMSRHVMNTMLVDKEEDVRRLSATVNGIKDILEFLKDVLSAESGIPQVKLFGEQAQGLGSEAAGNIRLYYDDMHDEQVETLQPQLERIISLLLKSKDFQRKAPELKDLTEDFTVIFNSLWQMSAVDEAEAHFTQAKADDLYTKNGTLKGSEVANSRFGNKSYSYATVLDPSIKDRDEIEPQTAKPEPATPEGGLDVSKPAKGAKPGTSKKRPG